MDSDNHDGSLEAAAGEIENRLLATEEPELETQDEVVDEAETDEAVEAESDEDVVEQEAEPDEADDEDTQLETVAEWAEALEVPVEELMNQVRTTVKVNGESLEVTLQELAAGYQKDSDYRQKTEALSRERTQFEEEVSQKREQLQRASHEAANVLHTLEQQIAAQVNSEEMDKLRQTNPTEWTARRLQFQDQLQQFNQLRQNASQEYQAAIDQLNAAQAHAQQERMEQERQALMSAIPNWSAELDQKVTQYLANEHGYTPEEIMGVSDHRAIKIAYESMMYRAQQAEAAPIAKKVKQAPKLTKPTAQKSVTRNNIRDLKAKVKKTGDVRDAASAIEQMI